LANKNLHGQFINLLNEEHVEKTSSMNWMRSSTLKRATESIFAVQEQAITTKYIQRNVLHPPIDDTCRVCNIEKETVHHIVSGCGTLAPTKYLQRHDNVCKYVHELLLREHDLKENHTPWYQHQPRPVEETKQPKSFGTSPSKPTIGSI